MAKPQSKLPEVRGAVFTSAREALGLTVQDVSRKSCFSVRQIEQIENGESSSFYGPQNKVTAAKKVAGLLNLKEEDAFDFGGVLPNKSTDLTNTPEVAKENAPSSADPEKPAKSVTPVTPVTPTKPIKTNQATELKTSSEAQKSLAFGQSSESSSSAQYSQKKKIFLLMSIAAALVFSVVNLRPLFFPEPVKEGIVLVEETPPAAPSADTPTEASTTPAASSEAVATTPAVLAASTECPSADPAPVNYRPDAPKKAGDMVFLQSKTAQTVCVVDATGKIQNKTLEPGVGASIYGKPPLKVLTSGQSPVDMYFQGVKVRLSNTTAKNILLESAEIVQPLAPTDSQLR